MIIAKNTDGVVTSWNQAAERMFGYAAGEAICRPIGIIVPPERLSEEKEIIAAICRGEKVAHFETLRIGKAGQAIPVSLSVSPIRDAAGKITCASKIVRDITRQKQAEEALQAHTVKLEGMVTERTMELDLALRKERELGQLKSRFVSMASHEFRTPLSSVKLSASLIEKYAQPYQDEQIARHITKIKHSVNDLSAILGDFLSLEKLESGQLNVSPSEFELVGFCQEIAAEMQLLAKRGHQLTYGHTGPDRRILLDQQLLKHCLHNLLSNAIKYSGEGTVIHLETEITADGCRVSVLDQGIGIPESDQPNLFTPFFRAHNTGNIQGTGLGLNIVARYAGLMNGSVSFESASGLGTRFMLVFPMPVTDSDISPSPAGITGHGED